MIFLRLSPKLDRYCWKQLCVINCIMKILIHRALFLREDFFSETEGWQWRYGELMSEWTFCKVKLDLPYSKHRQSKYDENPGTIWCKLILFLNFNILHLWNWALRFYTGHAVKTMFSWWHCVMFFLPFLENCIWHVIQIVSYVDYLL